MCSFSFIHLIHIMGLNNPYFPALIVVVEHAHYAFSQ